MVNDEAARRRLTVDVVLPRESAASRPWVDGQRLFHLPIAVMRKAPATSNIDIRDENGASLPILNRSENERITQIALESAIRRFVSVPEQVAPRLRRYVRRLVSGNEPQAQAARVANLVSLVALLKGEHAHDDPFFIRLHQVIRDAASNSLIWLGIVGDPGERRVIKVGYDIALARAPLLPRRGGWQLSTFELDGEERDYYLYDRGDGSERGLVRRIANRLAVAIGWGAYDVAVETPYIRNTASYHLEFAPPPGVEVRSIRLRALLVSPAGSHKRAISQDDERDRAHLHFADLKVRRDGPAEIRMRVGRRGFLTYSALLSVVIATMLWLFEAHAIEAEARPDASAATLVLIPALLGVFVLRPGEHVLASRLLAGIRAVLFVLGVLCAASALVLVGVLPFGFRDAEEAWRAYASIATALGGIVAIGWVLSLDSVESLRKRSERIAARYRHYMPVCLLCAVLVTAGIWLTPASSGAGDWEHDPHMTVLLLIAILCGWVAQFADANPVNLRTLRVRRIAGWTLGWEGVALLIVIVSLSALDAGLLPWEIVRPIAKVTSLAVIGLLIVLEPLRRLKALGPIEDPEEEPWIPEEAQQSVARG